MFKKKSKNQDKLIQNTSNLDINTKISELNIAISKLDIKGFGDILDQYPNLDIVGEDGSNMQNLAINLATIFNSKNKEENFLQVTEQITDKINKHLVNQGKTTLEVDDIINKYFTNQVNSIIDNSNYVKTIDDNSIIIDTNKEQLQPITVNEKISKPVFSFFNRDKSKSLQKMVQSDELIKEKASPKNLNKVKSKSIQDISIPDSITSSLNTTTYDSVEQSSNIKKTQSSQNIFVLNPKISNPNENKVKSTQDISNSGMQQINSIDEVINKLKTSISNLDVKEVDKIITKYSEVIGTNEFIIQDLISILESKYQDQNSLEDKKLVRDTKQIITRIEKHLIKQDKVIKKIPTYVKTDNKLLEDIIIQATIELNKKLSKSTFSFFNKGKVILNKPSQTNIKIEEESKELQPLENSNIIDKSKSTLSSTLDNNISNTLIDIAYAIKQKNIISFLEKVNNPIIANFIIQNLKIDSDANVMQSLNFSVTKTIPISIANTLIILKNIKQQDKDKFEISLTKLMDNLNQIPEIGNILLKLVKKLLPSQSDQLVDDFTNIIQDMFDIVDLKKVDDNKKENKKSEDNIKINVYHAIEQEDIKLLFQLATDYPEIVETIPMFIRELQLLILPIMEINIPTTVKPMLTLIQNMLEGSWDSFDITISNLPKFKNLPVIKELLIKLNKNLVQDEQTQKLILYSINQLKTSNEKVEKLSTVDIIDEDIINEATEEVNTIGSSEVITEL